MNRTSLAVFCSLMLVAAGIYGETLRIPAEYEETSYTVHTLTGLTSDEKTKRKVLPAPLEIKKVVEHEEPFVAFVSKPRKGGDDKTDTQQVTLPFTERQALLDVLAKAEAAGREALSDRKALEDTLFESGDGEVKLVLVTRGGRTWVLRFLVGDFTYLLDKNLAAKVAAAVGKL